MIAEDPDQLAAFLNGETDDPGVVSVVRGGIQYPKRDRQLVPIKENQVSKMTDEELAKKAYETWNSYGGWALGSWGDPDVVDVWIAVVNLIREAEGLDWKREIADGLGWR